MSKELLNLIVTILVSITYLVFSLKMLLTFFKKISQPMSSATGLLLYGILFGFGFNLYSFSEIAIGAFHYYASSSQIILGIIYWLLFAAISFMFSFIIFRLSFSIIGIVTSENEKVELTKNNYTLAGIHLVIFNLICLSVSQSLVDFANTLVAYPQFPR